jgi:hypothetical protein
MGKHLENGDLEMDKSNQKGTWSYAWKGIGVSKEKRD